MKINSIKDLQKVLKLCRQTGVTTIEIDGVKLTLGPQPVSVRAPHIDLDAFPEANIRVPQYSPIQAQDTANSPIDTKIDMPDELSEEQLMFYSARPESPN